MTAASDRSGDGNGICGRAAGSGIFHPVKMVRRRSRPARTPGPNDRRFGLGEEVGQRWRFPGNALSISCRKARKIEMGGVMIRGYACKPETDSSEEPQRSLLLGAGCERIYMEKVPVSRRVGRAISWDADSVMIEPGHDGGKGPLPQCRHPEIGPARHPAPVGKSAAQAKFKVCTAPLQPSPPAAAGAAARWRGIQQSRKAVDRIERKTRP